MSRPYFPEPALAIVAAKLVFNYYHKDLQSMAGGAKQKESIRRIQGIV